MSLMSVTSAMWAGSRQAIDTTSDSWIAAQANYNATPTWGTQYRAIYMPIRVPRACTVLKLGFANNTTHAGNYDIGLYRPSGTTGTRLVSSGTQDKPGTAEIVIYDVTNTSIGPGLFYLALNLDTAADTVTGMTDTAPTPMARGILCETLANITLPATANWAYDQTLGFIPMLSALLQTVVS